MDVASLAWTYRVIPSLADKPGMCVRVGTRVEGA